MSFSRIPPAGRTRDFGRLRTRSAGLTLLEILIVLLILAIAAGLAVPMLAPRGVEPGRALQAVIDAARRAAVRRAQAVTLTLQPDGSWRVETHGRADSERLLTGKLSAPLGSETRLLISPLGACALVAQAGESALVLDPIRCQLRAGKR